MPRVDSTLTHTLASTLRVGAIILAAGESRRMGTLKQLLPWGDRTVVEASVDAACNARLVSQVIVVLGHEADQVRAVLEQRSRPKMRIALNPDYKLGMLSSVKAGISSLGPTVDAFFIAPSDQPEIPQEAYDHVIETFRKTLNEPGQSQDIVIPVHKGRGGHPTLFPAALRREIMDLPYDGRGLRDVIQEHEDRVIRVDMENAGIIHDLNTSEDYRQAIRRRDRTYTGGAGHDV